MTSSNISSVAILISSFMGAAVLSTKEGKLGKFNVIKLDTKIGTMKSGEKAEYVVLQSEVDGVITVVSLHPNIASKLFKTGEVDGYKMIDGTDLQTEGEMEVEQAVIAAFNQLIVPTVDEITEVVAVKVKKEKKEKVVVVKVKKEKVEVEVTEPKVTNKTQATQIFEEELAKQGNVITKQLRAPVIARFKSELLMGIPGSSTYYQNCKKAHA